jgi:hypothetical protein
MNMMKRPMYKSGGKTLKAVPKAKKKSLGKLPKKVRNMKNFLCWPLEIIRTAYTKLVDKVFGKRCKCINKLRSTKTFILCSDCGKVLNNG